MWPVRGGFVTRLRPSCKPDEPMSSVGGAEEGDVHPAYLVKGDDPSLVGEAVRGLIAELVGARDPALVVEEHGGSSSDPVDVTALLDALVTPPFITDRRVVVLREAGRLVAGDVACLLPWLEDPSPGVVLVLASGGGTVPATLVKTVQRSGAVVDTVVGTGRARDAWFRDRIATAGVNLDPRASRRLAAHLGSDMSRLDGVMSTLTAAYGAGARISEADLEPFLGQAGALAPWDLTDAIDSGDTAGSLAVLRRLLGPAGFHPLAVLSVLHRHYQAMLRMDGEEPVSSEEAAGILGIRSSFVARKATDQSKRLGRSRLRQAIVLLGEADADIRGATALAPEAVVELLVSRLSRLSHVRAASGGG